MSDSQPRDERGKFSDKVTDQEILLVFDKHHEEPFLTASEIADELDVTRQAVNYRLNQMLEDDLVGKKKAGARAVGWWAEVAPRLDPEFAEQVKDASREDAISLDELEDDLTPE